MTSVLQDWVTELPLMQQTVLLTAIRGPDGLPKYHASKFVLRWYRRCVLLSALDRRVLTDPCDPGGGSFTGPSVKVTSGARPGAGDEPWVGWEPQMDRHVGAYIAALDEVPHHFHLHLMHGAEILGYKHPDLRVREWWEKVYNRFVRDMHLWPELERELDKRLGDTREGWLAAADEATTR